MVQVFHGKVYNILCPADTQQFFIELIQPFRALLVQSCSIHLLARLNGQRADQQGNKQHNQERYRVPLQGKIERHEGIGKEKVNKDNAGQRGKDAPEIAGGRAGNQHNR